MSHEQSILGGILADPTRMDAVGHRLEPEHFTDASAGNLYASLRLLHEAGGIPRDMRLLADRLREAGITIDCGYLAQCCADGIAIHVPDYANEIIQAYQRRRVADALDHLRSRMEADTGDPTSLVQSAIGELEAIIHGTERSGSVTIGTAVDRVLADIQDGKNHRPIFFGLSSIDEITGGMLGGELIVLAARPGVGKSSMAWQVAEHSARQGRHVLFVSLEMSDRELARRSIASHSGVDSRILRDGHCNHHELDRMHGAGDELRELPISIWSPGGATAQQISGMLRWHKRRFDTRLLVVDYLGLVRPADTRRQRYEQLGEITGTLKQLAIQNEIPVLALCQLNREADGTPPALRHLRESGSIEQDADAVLLLHQHDGQHDAILAKHRHGSIGKVGLTFIAESTRFEDQNQGWEER